MGKGLNLAVDIFVPDLTLKVKNERATVEAMATSIAKAVKKNTKNAKDAHGRRMATPKDSGTEQNPNGKTLDRSGTFLRSIAASESKARRSKSAKTGPVQYVVKAQGKRPQNENVAGKKKRAREKQKQMRAAAVIGEAFGGLATGRGVSEGLEAKKRGAGIKLTRLRLRTADTNAALAGILSVAPKDKRARAGKRKTYRVFEASDEYMKIGGEKARKLLKYRLQSKRSKKVRTK